MQTEGLVVKQQEKMTTKQQATQNINIKSIHAKLGHIREDTMHATKNHLQ